MCGIAGIFGRANRNAMAAMLGIIAKRGPDDSGLYEDESVCLGHTRLSIIDPSPLGHQPMSSDDRLIWIVYNGEVYNFKEERSALEAEGRKFTSGTDTEVILALYERYGDSFVERLRGIFSFAIYDRRRGRGHERIFLARDHFGIKPLFYTQVGEGFAFASDPRAFVAAGLVIPELDPDAVRQLLMRGAVYQPKTILKNILCLEPGHTLVVTASGREQRCFWAPKPGRRHDLLSLSYAEQCLLLENELQQVVEEQLVSDVPLGAFLSGGLDSSLLVALMSRRVTRPVRTFSVGFDAGGASLDETEASSVVADYLGTDHERFEVDSKLAIDALPNFVASLGQPTVDGFNSYMVSKAAAKHVTVAISGTGADEIFAGYPWFSSMQDFSARRDARINDRIDAFVRRLRKAGFPTENISRFIPQSFVARYSSEYRHFSPAQAANLLGKSIWSTALLDVDDLASVDLLPDAGSLDRTTAICLAGYTSNQLLRDIDSTSMAHSLEVRVPFLDPSIVDFALSLSPESRLGPTEVNAVAGSYRHSGAKRILADIADKFLPPEVTSRSKRGFSMPIDIWLKGPIRPLLEDAIGNLSPLVANVIDQRAATRVLDRFMKGHCHWGQPWILLILELWSRNLSSMATKTGDENAIALS